MTAAEMTALAVALTGVVAAIFAGVRNLRGDKFKHDVDSSAALLSGYTGMVASLQAEIARMQNEHAEDRREWAQEKIALKAEFASELAERDARIDELGSQVYALTHRKPETRGRMSDGR